MSELNWNAKPSEAVWYGEVVFEIGGETESNYGYCSDIAEYPSPTLLCGPGVALLEVKVTNTHTGDVWEDWKQADSTKGYGE